MVLQTFGIGFSLEVECWPDLLYPTRIECELTEQNSFDEINHLWFIYHDTDELNTQDIVWFLDNQSSDKIDIYADGYIYKHAKVIKYKRYKRNNPFLAVEIETLEGF